MSYYRRNTRRYTPRASGWRGPPALEVLNESVTMSAASAFTEAEVSLIEEVGKMNRGRIKAMMIKEIHIEMQNATAGTGIDADNATTDWFQFQITSSSQSAEVEFSDKDCVFKYYHHFLDRGTAATFQEKTSPLIFKFPGAGVPYIKKRIWFAADDAGQGQANTYHFKIYYYFKYLNKKQATRMISQLQ
jgi:hypothetical protein